MVFGIGTDIVEVDRIRRFIEKGESFKRRVFTQEEITYCEQHRDPAPFFAARFSAKEAFVKALGTGFTGGIGFNQIGVYHVELGKPEISLTGQAEIVTRENGISRIHLSISHIKDWANAIVVLEKQ